MEYSCKQALIGRYYYQGPQWSVDAVERSPVSHKDGSVSCWKVSSVKDLSLQLKACLGRTWRGKGRGASVQCSLSPAIPSDRQS